jgi:hypothetical protein
LWLSVGASFGDGDFQSQPAGLLSDALVEYVRVYKPSQTLSTFDVKKNDFKVFPNPVNEQLQVFLPENEYHAVLFDINGKKVAEQKTTNSKVTLNFKNFPKGIYLLKIATEVGVFVKKIIK